VKAKQPLIIIAVGVVCAIVAVLIVQRQMSRAQPVPAPPEGIDMLVAARPIEYGEVLVAEGPDANAMFVSGWPKELRLEGAITKELLAGHKVRVLAAFVKHQPILDSQIVPEEDFTPPDMVREKVIVDREDIRSGRWRAGQKVDVLRVVNNAPAYFMRSVPVYAVGSLDPQGRPVKEKEPPPHVFLLVKREDHLAFLKAMYSSDLKLEEAADPSATEPVLVDTSSADEGKRQEVRGLLNVGRNLMKRGEHEKALVIFEEAGGRYPELTDVCAEAGRELSECRKVVAGRLYEDARVAVERDKDFTTALRLLDRLEEEFSGAEEAVRKSRELRRAVQQELGEHRAQAQYETVLADLKAALDEGNLPEADRIVGELRQLAQQEFQPTGGLPAPAAALADYERQLQDAANAYEVDRKVLESYLKQGKQEDARAKLDEMKGKFPAHPDIAQLEEEVKAGAASG